jgi:DNA-binding MarR family transcriptional regulator
MATAAAEPQEIDRFLDAFATFARSIRRARGAKPRAGERGLTLSQYGLLEPLLDQKVSRSTDLAEAAGIAPSTATRILDALERNGMVRRDRDEHDRRAVTVRLTPTGRRRLAAHRTWIQEQEIGLYRCMNRDQRAVAADLLLRLAALGEKLGEGPPPPD